MKKDIYKSIKISLSIINILFLIYTIVIFIFKSKITTLISPLNVAFFMLLNFFGILTLGYQKDKRTRTKDKITNIVIIFSILYLSTIYLIGNASGYIKNSFNIINIIYNLLFLIVMELFRNTILNKCNRTSNEQYIITVLFILFDILVLSSFSPVNIVGIAPLIAITLTSIIKNSLLSYTTYRYGYRPAIIYSFIMTTLPTIAPVYPNLTNYISLVFIITYSAIILYNISKPVRKDEEETANSYNKTFLYYVERVLLVAIVLIIFLVSGVFKYSISAIASDSMYPDLKKGDAIILEKVDKKNADDLKVGTIVAFLQDDKVITHRIIAVEEKDNINYFTTKGDNNNTKDIQKKTKDDIIGIVRFRIPLLGYPSVEISEIKNK